MPTLTYEELRWRDKALLGIASSLPNRWYFPRSFLDHLYTAQFVLAGALWVPLQVFVSFTGQLLGFDANRSIEVLVLLALAYVGVLLWTRAPRDLAEVKLTPHDRKRWARIGWMFIAVTGLGLPGVLLAASRWIQ